jgi:hypothetical protein
MMSMASVESTALSKPVGESHREPVTGVRGGPRAEYPLASPPEFPKIVAIAPAGTAKFEDFIAYVAVAATNAPDEFPVWSEGCRAHLAAMQDLWTEIRSQASCNSEQTHFVEGMLTEMTRAFEAGRKQSGRKTARALYSELVAGIPCA